LSSKARHAVAEFKDNYYVVGPLLETNPGFVDEAFAGSEEIMSKLQELGIPAQAGRWDIAGKPRCLLVGSKGVIRDQEKLLYTLWEDFGVDSMFGQWDYIEPVLFSTVCGMAIEAFAKQLGEDTELYAHFHEWLTGAGLLYLKRNAPHVSLSFTAHSTVLGRSISSTGVDLDHVLEDVEPLQEAKRHNVSAKFSMESVAARQADCFTAVSNATAKESLAFLGVSPMTTTPNGFDIDGIPDYAAETKAFTEKRKALLDFASHFLGKELNPDKTMLLSISGHYEYKNKGLDVLLESLHRLDEQLRLRRSDGTNVVAFCLVLGTHAGPQQETLQRLQKDISSSNTGGLIVTHVLTDKTNDPILSACRRLGLQNTVENRCNVIFVPASLDGNDGVLNIAYYDVLAGCDLGVYPSSYEPWGYTPLESIAYAVPAVTTDLAGFGMWVQEHHAGQPGVKVLERRSSSYDDAIGQLTGWLKEALSWNKTTWRERKTAARSMAAGFSWSQFFAYYVETYRKASVAKEDRITGMQKHQDEAAPQMLIAPINSAQPRMRPFSVVSQLPPELGELEDLAYSLWWVSEPTARELFRRLDPVVWAEVSHNPVAFLQHVDDVRVNEAVNSRAYMQLYRDVMERFKQSSDDRTCRIVGMKHVTQDRPVAYFSMEFGVHECLPIYSGGLGILSGDHLKTASDLRIPMVGVGLLYKFGYFVQRITKEGEQVPVYEENNFAEMPMRPVRDAEGERVRIALELPGRTVYAQVWVVHVTSVPLYLLDSDVEANSQKDRLLTSKLYDSSTRERIEQEIMLGIGGVRALRALKITPSVYHLNEGHSAFLLVEQLRVLMNEQGFDYETAREIVRARSVFTTHTPVPAGNERHNKSLVENYLHSYVSQWSLSWEQFWNLGHVFSGEDADFEMTVLALKLCSRYNGVSKLHGEVARGMWHKVWRGFLTEEVPIASITNGVHIGSWVADDVRALLESYTAMPLEQALLKPEAWKRIEDIPDNVLWETHNRLKAWLLETIRQSVQTHWTREGEDPGLLEQFRVRLNPAALTVGFARRIATYKRPLLVLKDLERLRDLVRHVTYPLQILYAGKAHPADRQAASLIKEIVQISKQPDFLGRVVFLEGYNIRLARALVSGVDLWLNNPIRPMEASGTSGMKAALNGVPNCSILDGWWDECYRAYPDSGWSVGEGIVLENRETQDLVDSGSLYDLFEERIVPAYYNRNARNVPEQWTKRMKSAMRAVLEQFTTNRMLDEYSKTMYEPAAKQSATLAKNSFARARELGEWKKKLPVRFSSLVLREVRLDGFEGNVLNANESLRVTTLVEPGRVRPTELLLEVVIQDRDGKALCIPLKHTGNNGSLLEYQGEFTPPHTGQYKYGIRAIPVHRDAVTKFESNVVSWG